MRRTPDRSGWRPAALLAAGLLLLAPTPAFASGYWTGFKRFWTDFIALLIITRVKGNKG